MRVFGRVLEPDIQPEIPGASTVRFEHCQSQVSAKTLSFHLIVSIFGLADISRVFEQALNLKCGRLSYPLRDRRLSMKIVLVQFPSSGATALCTWRTGSAGCEV